MCACIFALLRCHGKLHLNAMGNYTYDAGNIREHKTAIDLGDKVRVEKNAMWNGHK